MRIKFKELAKDIQREILISAEDKETIKEGAGYYIDSSLDSRTKTLKHYLDETESFWAFKSDFIVNYIDSNLTADDIKELQELCERSNHIIKALIEKKIDSFCQDAILSDGIGHLMNPFDGHVYYVSADKIYIPVE